MSRQMSREKEACTRRGEGASRASVGIADEEIEMQMRKLVGRRAGGHACCFMTINPKSCINLENLPLREQRLKERVTPGLLRC